MYFGIASLTRTRTQDGLNPTYLLAWIPETLLDEKGKDEWDKFTKVEAKAADLAMAIALCADVMMLMPRPEANPGCEYTQYALVPLGAHGLEIGQSRDASS